MTPSTTDSLALAATIARRPPATEFVYEAVVDIGERVSIGQAPLGERFIVPIIGGVFKGADIEGVVHRELLADRSDTAVGDANLHGVARIDPRRQTEPCVDVLLRLLAISLVVVQHATD